MIHYYSISPIFRPVFNAEHDDHLAEYLLFMENRLCDLTVMDLRLLAFQFATKNHTEHRFNPDTQMTGEDCVYGFFRRHPRLSLRKPEPTSAARASEFNKPTISNVFNCWVLYMRNTTFVCLTWTKLE